MIWLCGILAVIVGYLIGSVNSSIVVSKLMAKDDIRNYGSGNAGATNVLRSLGVKAAVFTSILDILKGVVAVLLGKLIFSIIMPQTSSFINEIIIYGGYLAGLGCVFGHVYPIFFGFKGGKGVLITASVMLAADWRMFLISIGIFIIIFAFSKIVSLASIFAALSLPIGAFIITYFSGYKTGNFSQTFLIVTVIFTCILAILIIAKHHSNIKRLLNGTEKKLEIKKK